MICKCGGSTTEHNVVRKKQVAAIYVKCVACSRISWIKEPSPELKKELQK